MKLNYSKMHALRKDKDIHCQCQDKNTDVFTFLLLYFESLHFSSGVFLIYTIEASPPSEVVRRSECIALRIVFTVQRAERKSSEFRVRSAECRKQSTESKVETVKSTVQSAEFRVQSAKCRVQGEESAKWPKNH